MISGRGKKIMVAMSGGVDSSVAAYLLQNEGYEVVGVTMRFWIDPFAEETAGAEARGCCSLDAVNDARRVAAILDIPHYVLNMREEFYNNVVCRFEKDYLMGRTPNPCIECNRDIKFSHLLYKAKGLGINWIATGHYARVVFDKEEQRYRLYRSLNYWKDQSYMLYVLNQYELAATIFPLGNKTKEEVRKIAGSVGLPIAQKEESQEICFIPDNDYRSFLERRSSEALQAGDILDTAGNLIGRHRGIAFYTVGQRKGLGLTTCVPYYVVSINAERNQLIVGPVEKTYSRGLKAEKLNFIAPAPTKPVKGEVKIRYRAPAVEAILYPPQDGEMEIVFKSKQQAVTPGQSAVFYRGEEVVGGGIINFAIN